MGSEQYSQNMTSEIDYTIKSVCERIQSKDIANKYYSDTVKALAMLVEARAKLFS